MRVNISNFLSFGEDVCVDIPIGLTLIAGEIDEVSGSSNGAGKSGLLEAITFAIWGKARGTGEYPGGEHLVRDGCSNMSVGLILGGVEIIRKRGGGSTSLGVTVDNIKQKFPTIAAGDAIVSGYIGIDYDTFIRTAYFQQGKDKAFSELTSTEARKKVIEILGLDKWAHRQQRIKPEMEAIKIDLAICADFSTKNSEVDVNKQIENISVDLGVIAQVISDVRTKMGEMDVNIDDKRVCVNGFASRVTQARELISAEAITQTRISAASKEINDKDVESKNIQSDVALKVAEVEGCVSKLGRLEGELRGTDVKGVEDKLLVTNVKVTSLEAVRDQQTISIGIAENEQEVLENRKVTLGIKNVGVCPILNEDCDRISKDCIEEAIVNVEALLVAQKDNIKRIQDVKELTTRLVNEAISERDAFSKEIDRAGILQQDINTTGVLIGHTKQRIGDLRAHGLVVDEAMGRARSAHEVMVEELNAIVVAKSGFEELLKEAGEQERQLKALLDDREHLNDQLTHVIADKSLQENIKENLVKKLKEIAENIKRLKALENEYVMWDLLSQAFGPNGVPAMQIDAMKEEVEVMANNILQFGNQGVTVRIQLKEQKKAGDGSKDVFKIIVCDKNDKELPLFRFSGGEGYWVDLAIRVALYLVWRSKNGKSPLDLVMIDEGVGKVDAVKRRVLIDVLRYMTTKVPRVLIITHSDVKNMIESFDNVITIRKNKDVSVATIFRGGYESIAG